MKMRNKRCSVTVFWLLLFISGVLAIPQYSMTSTVSGKVIDEETGEGIKEVTVNIFHSEGRGVSSTDQDGKFVFYEVGHGGISVMFFPPPPYALPLYSELGNKFMVENGKNLYIIKKFGHGGTIIGKVYDKTSNNLLKINAIYLKKYVYYNSFVTKILNGGDYRIEQVKPGVHTLFVQLDGYGPREIVDISINKDETLRIDIPFESYSPTKVIGKVSCAENNENKKNIGVTLKNLKTDFFTDSYTNEEGKYIFRDVLPGDYLVVVGGDDGEKLVKYEKVLKIIEGVTSIANFNVDCSLDFSGLTVGEK